MPGKNPEVAFVLVALTVVFLVLSGVVVYVLFFYQRRRFQHKHQLIELQKRFNETLLTSQLEIQEHDFGIISREIHDNVGQILSLAKIQLNIISQSDHIDKSMVNDVKDNITKVMTDLRDIAKGLNGDRVEISNLYETIMLEVDRINRCGTIYGSVTVEGSEREFNNQKKLILFRIIQESLQNILKHSNANNFFIQLFYRQDQAEVEITDNGRGFNTEEMLAKKSGLGLSNIIKRSELIGGAAAFQSSSNKGTTLSIKIPYD
jgi:two-component system, NarL family, sensor kinase